MRMVFSLVLNLFSKRAPNSVKAREFSEIHRDSFSVCVCGGGETTKPAGVRFGSLKEDWRYNLTGYSDHQVGI